MAYSTNSDVVNEFKSLDTSGIITTAKIDQWITEADAYINGRIGLIYTTPVTGSESLSILKTVSIGMVAQRIQRVLETKSTTARGDQFIPKELIEEAKETLKMIVDRELILSDADSKTSEQGVSSFTSAGTICNTFDETKQQW